LIGWLVAGAELLGKVIRVTIAKPQASLKPNQPGNYAAIMKHLLEVVN
jgi:hypothetical protein